MSADRHAVPGARGAPLSPGAAGQPGAAPGGGRGDRAAGRRRRAAPAAHRDLGRHVARPAHTPPSIVGTLTTRRPRPSTSGGPSCSGSMGSQVRMKRTPRLQFAADPAVSAGARVEEVLRRLAPHRPAVSQRGRARAGGPGDRRADARVCGLVRGGQGGRLDLPRRGGPVPADLRPAPGRPRRDPRPRRHRRAAGRPRPGDPAAAVPDRAAQDLHGRGGARARRPPPSTPRARWSGTWDMAG